MMSDRNVDVGQKADINERADLNILQIFAHIMGSIVELYNFKFDRKQKIQFSLAVFVFLTFGVGDGFTSAHMINVGGILSEANPFIRFIAETQGWMGLIFFKLGMTFIILSVVIFNEKYSKDPMYWMTNGFLVALGIGGIMATVANLMSAFNFSILGCGVPSPILVIKVYTGLMIVLMLFGNLIDNWTTSKSECAPVSCSYDM